MKLRTTRRHKGVHRETISKFKLCVIAITVVFTIWIITAAYLYDSHPFLYSFIQYFIFYPTQLVLLMLAAFHKGREGE